MRGNTKNWASLFHSSAMIGLLRWKSGTPTPSGSPKENFVVRKINEKPNDKLPEPFESFD
jgi:hypothetical protein